MELATQTTMNDNSRRLFYVYHPELEERQAFNEHCRTSERTIVLGCYVSFKGIYIYNVTDERLYGVTQVTAAHELLHAAYGRLSPSEKGRVNGLLNDAFAKVTDQRIRDTIEDYRKNGADTNNELHSILGTEVRILPPALEKYYSKFFANRGVVVGYSEKYVQAFEQRKAQADSYKQQMNAVQAQLKDLKVSIDQQEAALSQERNALEADRRSADTPEEVQAFNARVASYNNKVRTYQASITKFNTLVATFNDLVNKYNAIAVEESELIKALDSRPTTIEKQ